MEILNSYLTQILLTVILVIAAFLGAQAKALYKRYVTTEIKQAVCRTTVRYIEQVYKDIHGPDKLREAMERASKLLAEKGISISNLELISMLEAAVNEFNNAFHKTEALPAYEEGKEDPGDKKVYIGSH